MMSVCCAVLVQWLVPLDGVPLRLLALCSGVDASLNQPPSLWSSVPRLSPDATALLPLDYRLPVGPCCSDWK